VVDEPRLELGEQGREVVDIHLVLGPLRVEVTEGLLDQPTGEVDEGERARAGPVDHHLPAVQVFPPSGVVERRVRQHRGHLVPPPDRAAPE